MVEVLIENAVDLQAGIRRLHVMGNEPVADSWLEKTPKGAEVKRYMECGAHHLTAAWPVRGELVEFRSDFPCGADCPVCHGAGCSWRRLVALYYLRPGETIRGAIVEAAMAYALTTGMDPEFAWVKELPKGVEWGTPILVGAKREVLLFEAVWMPVRAVAVGRGNGD